jgi:hypothetical protein
MRTLLDQLLSKYQTCGNLFYYQYAGTRLDDALVNTTSRSVPAQRHLTPGRVGNSLERNGLTAFRPPALDSTAS